MTRFYGFFRCILMDKPPVQLKVVCNGKPIGQIENGKKLLVDASAVNGMFNFEIISNREICELETLEIDLSDSHATTTIPARLQEQKGWGFSVKTPIAEHQDEREQDVFATIDIGYH